MNADVDAFLDHRPREEEEEEEDGANEELGAGTGAEQEDTSGLSKLRANIKKKGSNSYYYAHASTAPATGPVTDSLPQPSNKAPELPKTAFRAQVETYSWSNGKAVVSVYIPIALPQGAGEDATKLTWTASSVELEIREAPTALPKLFSILKTYEEIEGVDMKRKEDKIVLLLKKKDKDRTWWKLSQTML